jgi:hypothetical protein
MNDEVIILPALFGAVVWLVYIVVDGFRRRQRLRVFTEFHSKLLDRIGSAKEFGEFFTSEAGHRFLDSLASEKGLPHVRILSALQWGLTLLVLGVALFVLTAIRSYDTEAVDVLSFVGTVAVGVGIGTLLSALFSFALSRKMGLIPRRDGDI